jgi:hypothetical protein
VLNRIPSGRHRHEIPNDRFGWQKATTRQKQRVPHAATEYYLDTDLPLSINGAHTTRLPTPNPFPEVVYTNSSSVM